MSYDVARAKAWDELNKLAPAQELKLRFLADEYSVRPAEKQVACLSNPRPAGDMAAILILHYLAASLKGLPAVQGEWLTFRELSDVEGYYPAFRKRALMPVVKKYGSDPKNIFAVLERIPGKKAEAGDSAIILEAFEGVPALLKVWAADQEFGADANMYFDRSIKTIFCTEDIVVLAGVIACKI